MMSKEDHGKPEALWQPQFAGSTPMDKYREHINEKFGQNLVSSDELQRWTVSNQQSFYVDLYTYLGLTPKLPKDITKAYDESVPMSAVPEFFPGLMMNYAQNSLFANHHGSHPALIQVREGDEDGTVVTWSKLRERVRLVASALRHSGVKKGDVIAAIVSNSIWAVVLFHATASLGAIFTSIAPDLGTEGCVARLKQVEPKIIFADGDATYKGKTTSLVKKIEDIKSQLSHKFEVFLMPAKIEKPESDIPLMQKVFMHRAQEFEELKFTRVPFNHPLVICYSSGTTGRPKCIVHQHGIIMQFRKISMLHNSLSQKDTVLQYCSTSWVVFYIMMGHLSTGATLVLYDGAAMYPDPRALLRLIEKYRVTYFGTSPRYLLELEQHHVTPALEFDLGSLRLMYTTGAPLTREQYAWIYRSFPSEMHLANTAGGTDTATSIIAADPTAPVRMGEMQMAALGMAVDIADPASADARSTMADGSAGELIIRKPFPSMPVYFWGDDEQRSIYRGSYFTRFPDADVWCQHDWLVRNPATGGFVMSGRSDGVLNPSGIRFGSGEIYAIVEAPPFNSTISQALCVGRRRPGDKDEDVFLFVHCLPGHSLTSSLKRQLRESIRRNLSPRHVPKFIIEVDDIPVTVNGKKVEVGVKEIISGKDVEPSSTVANPDVLEDFKEYRNVEAESRNEKL